MIRRGSRRQRTTQKQPLPLHYILFLVCVTAILTWQISRFVHNALGVKNIRRHGGYATLLNHQNDGSSIYVVESSSKQQNNKPKGHIDYSDYTGPSKVYTKFEHPFPCFEGEKGLMKTTPSHEGILFQRPLKTGSTTMTGIVLRLVHNRGQQQYGYDKCKHRSMHGTGVSYDFFRRDKAKSFLFSIIREPQARAISQVFHFDVSVGMNEPTDNYVKSRLLQNYNHLHYFDDLGTRNYTIPRNESALRLEFARRKGFKNIKLHLNALKGASPEEKRAYDREWKEWRKYGRDFTPHKIIKDVLDDYNLVAVMERMDESLVVFQMLFNLTTKEILYTRARSGGSFSNGFKDRPCLYILPSFVSPGIKQFLDSDEWKSHIAPDVEFYKAAHKSLDRTIQALGRKEFKKKLTTFQSALKLAAKNCEGRVRTMCSSGGAVIKPRNTTCYFWGEGCDHDCIDELDL